MCSLELHRIGLVLVRHLCEQVREDWSRRVTIRRYEASVELRYLAWFAVFTRDDRLRRAASVHIAVGKRSYHR